MILKESNIIHQINNNLTMKQELFFLELKYVKILNILRVFIDELHYN